MGSVSTVTTIAPLPSLATIAPTPGPELAPKPVPDAPPPKTTLKELYAPAQGKQGAALLRELAKIAAEGHVPRTYDNARHMMFRVVDDLDNDDVVTELYTGRKVAGVDGLNTAVKKHLTAEHVWPQSHGATEIARADMHHLQPADGTMNSVRNNLPYGDVEHAFWSSPAVDGVRELSIVGTDVNGTKVFEPRASMQGDLARMQLYFFTRYHGDRPKQDSLKNFQLSLPALLKWHAADPVSDAERARNDIVARLQGNRNPFIDHPEFVEKVGFRPQMLRKPPNRRSYLPGE